MADEFDDFNDDDQEPSGDDSGRETNPARRRQRELEKQLRDAKEALKTAEGAASKGKEAEKELLFKKAGIDTESGPGKLLLKSWDGELTVEAIKTGAEEYGLVPTSQTAAIADELRATTQIAQASTSPGSSAPPLNPLDEIRAAKTIDQVVALAAKYGSSISNEEVTASDVRPLGSF